MNIKQLLEQLKCDERVAKNITCWTRIPPREAVYEEFPRDIDIRIKNALKSKGIYKLYSHQASAISETRKKKNIVVVTPTASGKTLCYNIPL